MTRRYTRLTPDEWNCLIDLYATGVATIPALADRYSVSTSSITQKVRAAGKTRTVSFGAGIATATSAVSAIAGIKLDPIAPIGNRKPTTEETEARVIATNAAALHGAMMGEQLVYIAFAALAASPPTTLNDVSALSRVLEKLTAAHERAINIRRKALRMDRENSNSDAILPELPIRTMTDAEVRAIRVEQAIQDGNPIADQIDPLDQLDQVQDVEATTEDDDHVEGFQEAALAA